MKIAVEGCCHGELDKIYAAMQHVERAEGITIDLLICCGDFQAVRNVDDLECMSVPQKYKALGTFHEYYSGRKRAPYPTLFIGGNHEASNYLYELYYGGFVAPDIFYLGHSGVVHFGDLRVGGLSGIFKAGDYRKGHHERPPFAGRDVKTAYHVREFDVGKLKRLREPLDVFLSHDWPRGVARHGDLEGLLRRKRFLAEEIRDDSLGSPPARELMTALKPAFWFSAHMHVKFAALVTHDDGRETRFLALDKCLPGRDFMQILDFPDKRPDGGFALDPEWLAILRANHRLDSLDHRGTPGDAALSGEGEHRAFVDAKASFSPPGEEDDHRTTTRRGAEAEAEAEETAKKPEAEAEAETETETETSSGGGERNRNDGDGGEEKNNTRPAGGRRRGPAPPAFAPTAPAHYPERETRRAGRGTAPSVVARNPQTPPSRRCSSWTSGSTRRRERREAGAATAPRGRIVPPPPPPPRGEPFVRPGAPLAPPPNAGVTAYAIPGRGPFGTLVPRNLPPPPRLADGNEIELDEDEEA